MAPSKTSRKYAAEHGIDIQRISLDDQFRCGGSKAYIEWVQRLLGLHPGGPIPWEGDPHFDVQVVDSPFELGHLMVSDRSENTDPDFRNTKTVSDDRFDELVRNVYKVLLARGRHGVVIYSPDGETRTFLDALSG